MDKLIDRLPKSYKELNYKTYVKIIQSIPGDIPQGMDDAEFSEILHLTSLSIMLDVPVEALQALKAREVIELIQAIDYLENEPTEDKIKLYAVKSMDELTYDEFASYQRLRLDQWDNLGDILLIAVKDATPEVINNMSIHDAMQVFFCMKKITRTYLRRLIYSTARQAIWRTIVKNLPWRKTPTKPKRNLKSVGVGLT